MSFCLDAKRPNKIKDKRFRQLSGRFLSNPFELPFPSREKEKEFFTQVQHPAFGATAKTNSISQGNK